MSDGTERRRRITGLLVEALDVDSLRCADGDVRDLAWADITVVSAHDVRNAATCAASPAADPDEFVPSPVLATRALALSAGRRIHRVDTLTDAVRAAMVEALDSDRWPGPFLRDETRDVRALCASKALTWLARTLDVLAVDDFQRWQFNRDLTWNFPGRGLKLKAKLDLCPPRDPVPILVVPNTDPAVIRQVAFTLLLMQATDPRPLDEARIVVHATGELLSVEPEAMIDDGVSAATAALAAVVERPTRPPGGLDAGEPGPSAVAGRPPHHLDRSPSPLGCLRCGFTACPDRMNRTVTALTVEPGETMAGPAVRGGIRLVG